MLWCSCCSIKPMLVVWQSVFAQKFIWISTSKRNVMKTTIAVTHTRHSNLNHMCWLVRNLTTLWSLDCVKSGCQWYESIWSPASLGVKKSSGSFVLCTYMRHAKKIFISHLPTTARCKPRDLEHTSLETSNTQATNTTCHESWWGEKSILFGLKAWNWVAPS